MPVHERSEKEYFTRRRDGWVSTRVSNFATRLRFQNILYATDLSFAAERALPYALEIARRYGATIHVVHVIQADVYPLVPPSAWSKMAEAEEVFREESKRDLEEQLKSVPHEIIFRRGKTWPILSQLIEEKQIDLVVFSTHGGGGLQKLIFGSVADELFQKSPCPILAVGPGVRIKPRANAELNRILYATDFKAESLAAAPMRPHLPKSIAHSSFCCIRSRMKAMCLRYCIHCGNWFLLERSSGRSQSASSSVEHRPARSSKLPKHTERILSCSAYKATARTSENICSARAYSKSSRAQRVRYLWCVASAPGHFK